jgi:hypothetical protein
MAHGSENWREGAGVESAAVLLLPREGSNASEGGSKREGGVKRGTRDERSATRSTD